HRERKHNLLAARPGYQVEVLHGLHAIELADRGNAIDPAAIVGWHFSRLHVLFGLPPRRVGRGFGELFGRKVLAFFCTRPGSDRHLGYEVAAFNETPDGVLGALADGLPFTVVEDTETSLRILVFQLQ